MSVSLFILLCFVSSSCCFLLNVRHEHNVFVGRDVLLSPGFGDRKVKKESGEESKWLLSTSKERRGKKRKEPGKKKTNEETEYFVQASICCLIHVFFYLLSLPFFLVLFPWFCLPFLLLLSSPPSDFLLISSFLSSAQSYLRVNSVSESCILHNKTRQGRQKEDEEEEVTAKDSFTRIWWRIQQMEWKKKEWKRGMKEEKKKRTK